MNLYDAEGKRLKIDEMEVGKNQRNSESKKESQDQKNNRSKKVRV